MPDTLTAANLRLRRLALGLSQEQLAARLGVTASSIFRWETGRSPVPPLLDGALRDLERVATLAASSPVTVEEMTDDLLPPASVLRDLGIET